jgi:hypothetical protein
MLSRTQTWGDGPVKWVSLSSRAPGIFVVEQSTPDALAMLEITAIRAWVTAPTFQLDGKRPEPAVADRLRSFWLPASTSCTSAAAPSPWCARRRPVRHALGDGGRIRRPLAQDWRREPARVVGGDGRS